ncbi:MAG: broad specificity phosphatase PhoE [Pseudohongiellaceae bacterium]|jgi:broad specificity phosphatase PhoE
MNNTQQVTTIDLLRHGSCEGGLIFRGHTDSALNEQGWRQMQQAITHAPSWDNIISSPLQRCKAFAESLSENVTLKSHLQEISFGDWDGQLTETVQQLIPHAAEAFWQNPENNTPPNGEALVDFQQRVVPAWQKITQQHRGQHSLVITHGGVIRIILAQVLQMPLQAIPFISIPHGCLSQIKIYHQDGTNDWPQLIFHQPLNTA